MVSVAQLVEPRIVIPVVVGSSPIVHPIIGSSNINNAMDGMAVENGLNGPLAQLGDWRVREPGTHSHGRLGWGLEYY